MGFSIQSGRKLGYLCCLLFQFLHRVILFSTLWSRPDQSRKKAFPCFLRYLCCLLFQFLSLLFDRPRIAATSVGRKTGHHAEGVKRNPKDVKGQMSPQSQPKTDGSISTRLFALRLSARAYGLSFISKAS